MSWLEKLDTQLFLWLNGLHTEGLDPLMQWITEKQSWYGFYAAFIVWLLWRYRVKGIWFLLTIVLTIVLADQTASSVLKPIFERLRPCHEPHLQGLIHLTGDCGGQFGFASSHGANSFGFVSIVVLLLGQSNKWLKILFIWAIIVSYSRIYVGVHYPLDVLAGAGIGVLAALLCKQIFHKFQPT